MDDFDSMHSEVMGGYDIVFSVAPEHMEPDWDFQDAADKQDTLDRIDRGDLVYFIARVQAFRHGVLLATDYLGGCCYDSYDQFIESSDYYKGMIDNVIDEADEMVKRLQVAA